MKIIYLPALCTFVLRGGFAFSRQSRLGVASDLAKERVFGQMGIVIFENGAIMREKLRRKSAQNGGIL